MEWKEHIAWIAPMLATAAAFMVLYYGHNLVAEKRLRTIVLVLFVGAFLAAAIAASGNLTGIAEHDPNRFTPGAPSFLTQDEEMSGIIPAPFLGEGKYLLDVQAHDTIAGEIAQGGQLLELHVPPGRFR
jgi:hypothetical protein